MRRALFDRMPICARVSCGLVLAASLAGCEERSRPWGGEGPPVVLAPPPPGQAGDAQDQDAADGTAGTGAGSAGGAANNGAGAADAGADASTNGAPPPGDGPREADPDAPPVTPGGLWARCQEGFTLSGDPLKDVTRLGLLCGPSNGMRRKSRQALVGVIAETEPPVTAPVRVARGACYRAFAVADAQVGELEVTFRSSRDATVARDHGTGRLAVVQPDRPFCSLADDVLTMEVKARRGSGWFAAEVWSLGERRKKGDAADAPADEAPLSEP
jgi:hypothetical protein